MPLIKRSLLCAASSIALLGSAHAALTKAGDLQFTAFNADEDGFAMVTLVDISANSTLFFSDNEYLGGAFNTGESYFRWDSAACPCRRAWANHKTSWHGCCTQADRPLRDNESGQRMSPKGGGEARSTVEAG